MKKVILALMILVINVGAISAQEWQTDFNKAKTLASKDNKPIILVFQGSDWCAPCMKLDRSIWSTDTFKTYAKEHYVMLQADFPRKNSNSLSKEQMAANAKLAETYNTNGIFPFVVVLDHNGNVLGETGYKKTTPDAYIKDLNAFIK
ncbi:thioredoxin family protein [Sediminibacter sp. Hel_I_10]|uniref:thioredoxin family protein n=1 Tax=Sediminibacter sp. Hel_I_10 TaxID=1392490 RepID=UPI00047A9922|nr:thioredoxin family protein [Sediminibacter sp. Hel_I_10]